MPAISKSQLKNELDRSIYKPPLNKAEDQPMVSRIRRTPTVEERAVAVERTDKVAQMAAEEERQRREDKNAKLRALRLASSNGASAD